ncbi:MAG: stringent starvation protein [Pseudomonadota bacterium]|nr:stringent starvation protein [Pseudomonadota bacterium]
MTSSRPYLIRALYQWIVDNGVTPYILVDASVEGVTAPEQYIQDGKIVLNIAPMAVRSLVLADEHISFNARFGGQSTDIFIPVAAVLAIYARENGQGMMFNDEPRNPEPPKPGGPSPEDDTGNKPKLRIVK